MGRNWIQLVQLPTAAARLRVHGGLRLKKRGDVGDVHAQLQLSRVALSVERAAGQRVVDVAAPRRVHRAHAQLAQVLAVRLQRQVLALVAEGLATVLTCMFA
jgi:hypothetical protein